MAEPDANRSGWLTTLFVALFLGGAGVTSLLLHWLGDWEAHRWGLELAERIVWGCCLIAALAVVLTGVTIFGWSFRRYFRWPGDGAPDGRRPVRTRPVRAPWGKSPIASFSTTVILVSLTGTAMIACAVLWMLKDVVGEWTFWLVTGIVVSSWWALCIFTVITRVTLFERERRKTVRQLAAGGTEGNGSSDGTPAPPGPGDSTASQEASRPAEGQGD
jgi:hypothetical protein